MAPHGTFLEAQDPSQNPHPKWSLLELFLNSVLPLKCMFKRPHFWKVFSTALGPPKKCSVAPKGRPDPPQMEPNLGLQNMNF